jgi:hypothetical protein
MLGKPMLGTDGQHLVAPHGALEDRFSEAISKLSPQSDYVALCRPQ